MVPLSSTKDRVGKNRGVKQGNTKSAIHRVKTMPIVNQKPQSVKVPIEKKTADLRSKVTDSFGAMKTIAFKAVGKAEQVAG
mmetsp:Transcript_28543/g.44647  ORF Transcript_28543/g.44647 Transcript_28543/m.44647 type:complete len:81 (+) Transcript_28543:873-1115(+)